MRWSTTLQGVSALVYGKYRYSSFQTNKCGRKPKTAAVHLTGILQQWELSYLAGHCNSCYGCHHGVRISPYTLNLDVKSGYRPSQICTLP
eukprot:scaffold98547_cov42-Cyclotella_meneghiniana.AAC.1